MRRASARPPSGAFDDEGEPVLELRPMSMRPSREPPRDAASGGGGGFGGASPIYSLGPMPMRVMREPPNAPPQVFADPAALLASVRAATARDELLQLLLVGMRAIARKAALFVVRRDAYVGWSCNPELGDEARLREVKIPLKLPSALATAAAGTTYLGPIYASEAHDALLAVMGSATGDVAITSVRVSGHAVVLMLADELVDTMIGTYRMEEIARAAGEVLSRILRRGR
jgi:hypothetical protein